jgi:hypothetical protein
MTDKIEHANIYEALLAAQSDFQAINKDSKAEIKKDGKTVKSYTYAALANVLDAVLPSLNRNGLILMQNPHHKEGRLFLTTSFIFKDGTKIESEMQLDTSNSQISGMQALGSAITYARRYTILSLLGVATEDDDGAAAQKSHDVNKDNLKQEQKNNDALIATSKTWFDWIGKVKTSTKLDEHHGDIFGIAKGLENVNELDKATELKSAFITKQTELRAKESVVQDGLQGSRVGA